MGRFEELEFTGDRALIVHTGMRSFSRQVRWRASDSQEGLLLDADGGVRAVLPGETLWPGRVGSGRGDLFVLRRDGALTGVVGTGGVTGSDGVSRGGYGQFACAVLLPRRLLPAAARAFDRDETLSSMAAGVMRPALRRAMEEASCRSDDPARLRVEIARLAFEPMRDRLLTVGLLLERFDMERFDRIERA